MSTDKQTIKVMTKTVVGIFDDPTAAQTAFQKLTSDGFNRSEVDVTDNANVGSMNSEIERRDRSDDDFGDKVGRFFRNLFESEEDAERYSTAARTGSVVSVYADTWERAERAADVLDDCGAINVDERVVGDSMRSDSRMDQDRDVSNRSIPVIEEELEVGKREVETGGMRLRSRIIDRPVEENLRLREEHVTVERNPVNRPANESDLNTFREGEVEVRERAEIPVINKQARVVEEVNLRKDVRERDELVRDTVRKTDVEVDKLEGDTTEGGTNRTTKKRK